MILTVTLPGPISRAADLFGDYYYGGADDVRVATGPLGGITYVLVYSDENLARAQQNRFWSGLYATNLEGDE